ncbi:SCO family protein [Actibacterium sp. 188UL27-1]|uniref:SCO family protein n=1 Tax=Actibacterium sp. 188UL27-1 TaxID=2786961 RepID=UPI00195674CE|nr:SCO family protein [Actibacterium sp. 188UL27-1]MBM7067225.1 SCO family protein [Actibacterium sp. 188UL27-1]
MDRLYVSVAAVSVAAVVGGTAAFVFLGGEPDKYADCISAKVGGDAQIGGPFELISETGETVTDAQVIDKPTLVYFGYTFCPDVCPLDTVRNAEAVDLLKEKDLTVKPVFISVDHGRDTAETMDDFTANLHPDMLGLTGDEDQVRKAAQAYRAYYDIRDPDDEYYLVDHSTISYLMTPEEGFVAAFERAISGEQMAEQIACYLEAA